MFTGNLAVHTTDLKNLLGKPWLTAEDDIRLAQRQSAAPNQEDCKKINALEESMQALDDEGLRAKTQEFKERFQQGESLDALLLRRLRLSARAVSAQWACVTSTFS